MFSNDKNVETIAQLVEVLKHYIGLQSEYMKLDVIEKVVRLIDCDYLGSSILYHTSYFIHLPILRSSLCIATFGRFTSFGFPYSQWFLLTTIGYCHFTTTLSDRTPPSQILRESFNVK